jgi:hypothetical protein
MRIRNFSIGVLGAFFFMVFSFLIMGALARADVAVGAAALVPPDWLAGVVGSVLTMFPKVGVIVVLVVKWLGFVSGTLTALAIFLKSVSTIGQGLFSVVGLSKVAGWIDAVENAVLPWIKFLSMFNQTTPLPGAGVSINSKLGLK